MASQINSISKLTTKNELATAEAVSYKRSRKSAIKESANNESKSLSDIKTGTAAVAKISEKAKSLAAAEYINFTKEEVNNDSKQVAPKPDNSEHNADYIADEDVLNLGLLGVTSKNSSNKCNSQSFGII